MDEFMKVAEEHAERYFEHCSFILEVVGEIDYIKLSMSSAKKLVADVKVPRTEVVNFYAGPTAYAKQLVNQLAYQLFHRIKDLPA